MNHILFITQVCPFPTDGGERIRSLNLIKLLAFLGNRVTAIVSNENDPTTSSVYIENVTFIPFTYKKFGKYIYNYFSLDKRLLKIAQDIENTKPIDIVFLDYGFLGQYISFFKQMNKPVIYGSHNAEAQLTSQLPTFSLQVKLKKTIHFREQYMHERKYFPNTDIFLTVSEEDALYYSFVGGNKIKIIPNFLDLKEYSPATKQEGYWGFPANFFAYQNSEGMKWFLDEVWNDDLADRVEILLIGKGSEELLSQFANRRNIGKRIRATGNVVDTRPYIAQARAIIIPLQYGSGTRIKCLEAMALNCRIISTEKGMEGIKYDDSVLIGNSALEFRNHILNVLNDPVDLKINSRKIVEENYSLVSQQDRMKDLLSALRSGTVGGNIVREKD